jgi:type IV fimbrial biogenesis protein FimT
MRLRNKARLCTAGFTLYELIITLSIASLLAVLGSGIYGLLMREQVVAEANQFLTELNLARTEAIVRHQKITLCPARNGRHCDTGTDAVPWHDGSMMFIDANGDGELDPDERPLRMHMAASKRLRIKTSTYRPRVLYRPNGMTSGNPLTFTVCDTGNPKFLRYVIVSNVGRARVSAKPPDGKTDEALERCI